MQPLSFLFITRQLVYMSKKSTSFHKPINFDGFKIIHTSYIVASDKTLLCVLLSAALFIVDIIFGISIS